MPWKFNPMVLVLTCFLNDNYLHICPTPYQEKFLWVGQILSPTCPVIPTVLPAGTQWIPAGLLKRWIDSFSSQGQDLPSFYSSIHPSFLPLLHPPSSSPSIHPFIHTSLHLSIHRHSIHSFNKYSLSTYPEPHMALGAREAMGLHGLALWPWIDTVQPGG